VFAAPVVHKQVSTSY